MLHMQSNTDGKMYLKHEICLFVCLFVLISTVWFLNVNFLDDNTVITLKG